MDFALTDEQELIRSTAREFADKVIRPAADDNARKSHFDTDLVKRIAEQGYLGAIVPREYGGAGLDYITYGLIVDALRYIGATLKPIQRRRESGRKPGAVGAQATIFWRYSHTRSMTSKRRAIPRLRPIG